VTTLKAAAARTPPGPGGDKPIPRDDVDWKAILDAMASGYELPQKLSDDLPGRLLPVDADFKYARLPIDTSFRFWHVERF